MSLFDSVKDLAGAVGSTVTKGARNATDNSKKLIEKSKIKREISILEADINHSYVEIGKKYFEMISKAPSEEFAFDVDNIITKNAQLEEAKKTLMDLEDKHSCPQCGAPVFRDQKFCDKCGAKLEESIKVEVVEEINVKEGAECTPETDEKIIDVEETNE